MFSGLIALARAPGELGEAEVAVPSVRTGVGRTRTYNIRTEGGAEMARAKARREKWTLSFDADLKAFLVKTARRQRVYPVALLEEIVKEKFNPFGHADVRDSVAYVRALRRRSRKRSDASFLAEIRAWQQSASS